MNCSNCGQPMPDGATKCAKCGVSNTSAHAESDASIGNPSSGDEGADAGRARAVAHGPDAHKDVPPPSPNYRPGGDNILASGRSLSPLGRFVGRVKGILLAPRSEWQVISHEVATPADVYLRYVAPLAAVGVLATILGAAFPDAFRPEEKTLRLTAPAAVIGALVHFALTFAIVFVVAKIVNGLAPTFGGRKDPLRALQVTAFSFTPAWVAAVLAIVPALGGIAAVIGLYGLYLLYVGLPILMHAPVDKSLGYTVVVVICTFALTLAVALGTGLLINAFVPVDTGTVRA
ncbi:MAG TPA: YIP1 family protein [Casimicrobiaceae bacterium]|nr:YIP1 family protein [Casimicrobiaceae bacterium]